MYALLALVNLLMPKEAASHRVGRGLAYGPHRRHTLDIYAPRSGDGPWPVIYFLYGGSWNMGDRRFYAFVGRALAAAGYVVVIADYRLVPEVEYPVFLDDCAQGYAWTLQNIAAHGGDPNRVALMGHSAGAYNALMLRLSERQLADLGLESSVKAMVGLSGPYDFFPYDVDVTMRTFGAVADPRATQPVNLAVAGLPPTFLASGDADTLVFPRNTVALARALRAKGVKAVERHYQGVGHAGTLMALGAFGRRRAPVLSDVVTFLNAHV